MKLSNNLYTEQNLDYDLIELREFLRIKNLKILFFIETKSHYCINCSKKLSAN